MLGTLLHLTVQKSRRPLQGKTGKAVQDLFTPEIAATKSGYNTLDPMSIMTYDATHTNVRRACIVLNVSCGNLHSQRCSTADHVPCFVQHHETSA